MSADRTDLTDRDRQLVLGILAAHLPPESTAWVFGSRATGRARPLSDLDLAIDAGRTLTLAETAVLREALSDSDLPFLVDIVDWHAIDALPKIDRGRAGAALSASRWPMPCKGVS